MKAKLFSSLLAIPSLVVAQEQKPNIIIFLIDDMGLMDTSVPFITDEYGEPVRQPLNDWYRTPNMEQLASQGVRFSTFYAQSVSSPSRTSILTGHNSTRHHTTNWIKTENNNKDDYGPSDWNWEGLTKDDVTLPKVLKGAGYKTIHIGKAHFAPDGAEGVDPTNIGFDVNIAGSSIGQPGSYYGEYGYGHIKGNKNRAVPDLEKYHGTDTFLTEALTIEAKNEISKAVKEGKPFYLNMAHYAVHTPFEVDNRFVKNYENKGKDKKAIAFATLIEGVDKSLGDLMVHLDHLGVAEETIILFLGDNGSDAPLGPINDWCSSAPLRGKKGTMYEGGTRIPFIVSWAKNNTEIECQKKTKIAQGEIQTQMGTIMDIFPTLASISGANIPKGYIVDGYDIRKQLAGKQDKKRSSKLVMHFPHEHRSSYFTTYIDGDWKLIYQYNPETPESPIHTLYNLTNDPTETTDLSKDKVKKVREMVAEMSEILEKEDAQYPENQKKVLKPIL